MSGEPFLFLGHGEGPGTLDLWVALKDPRGDTAPAVAALEAWTVDDADVSVDAEGAVIALHCRRLARGLSQQLDVVLSQVHRATPLALVVRTNRVKGDAWHEHSLARPDAVLDVLEHHVLACSAADYRPFEIPLGESQASLHATAWAALPQLSVRGAFVQAALTVVHAGVKKKRAPAAVWHDLVVARLPTWLSRDFACDLAAQEQLARSLAIASGSIEMPARFVEAFAECVRRSHGARHEAVLPKATGFDWKDVAAVRAAVKLRGAKWSAVAGAFRDANREHARSLLALTHAERVSLAKRGSFALFMLNAATLLLSGGAFADALTLFEAGIEGRFPAGAAANPLYAVQDDNNHLGVDPKRHRRFLRRCLEHGPENPAVFLNASGVAMELGDTAEALRLLGEAKKHGLAIKAYKNDRLYMPLRELPAFKALMR